MNASPANPPLQAVKEEIHKKYRKIRIPLYARLPTDSILLFPRTLHTGEHGISVCGLCRVLQRGGSRWSIEGF